MMKRLWIRGLPTVTLLLPIFKALLGTRETIPKMLQDSAFFFIHSLTWGFLRVYSIPASIPSVGETVAYELKQQSLLFLRFGGRER